MKVAAKYPDRLQIAFRYYPQDPDCNPNPKFRVNGHLSACRAARAAEAARIVGGRDAYLKMRQTLWENQNRLPTVPVSQLNDRERSLFSDWAAEMGLDRAKFATAMESSEVTARIQSDIAEAERLGATVIPAIFVNGKRLRGWSKVETWDAILGAEAATTSQPATRATP